MARAPLLLFVALLSVGCISPPTGETDHHELPLLPPLPAGGLAPCPPAGAQVSDYRFSAEALSSWTGAKPGLANASDGSWVWTWRNVERGHPSENLGRAGTFSFYRLANSSWLVCGTVELTSPDPLPRATENVTLRVRIAPLDAIPNGTYQVLVNWEVGCADCGNVTRGNTSATFTHP